MTGILNTTYPLAPNGIFPSFQGEGALLGVPMVFVRLAGCSVNCPQCDTDYSVHERLSATEIGERVQEIRGKAQWVWITGGEPADHDLWPLLEAMRLCGKIALATSGTKPLRCPSGMIDFLSVSPHGKPIDMILRRGSQLNLVPGLNGLKLNDWTWDKFNFLREQFAHAFVTPLDGTDTTHECLAFVRDHQPHYRLGVQAHKQWGLP